MAGYLGMSQTMAWPIDEAFATAGRLDEYRPYQTIATYDIVKLVALAFDRPYDVIGYELEIAGSELTIRQAAEVFGRVLGRPVKFRRLPMPIVRVALGKEFIQTFHSSTTVATKPTSRACLPAIPSCSSGRLRTGFARRAGRASAR
jgi:hypothetical protein